MKRSHIVKMMYPVGCLLAFRGDDWLDDLKDVHGMVLSHNNDDSCGESEEAMQVLVNGKIISILCDEFEDEEIELIEGC